MNKLDLIYRQHYGKLVSALISYFGLANVAVAEDIVHDTFVSAIQNWEAEGEPSDVSAWLFRVCKNKTINYLQKNIRINTAGSPAKFQFRQKESFDKSKIKSQPQLKQFQNSTHILMVEMNNLSMSESQLNVSLPMNYDTWYRDWSTMNDKTIDGRQHKTFAFQHLIDGVLEAFDTRNKEFIKFSINLIKD